MYYWIDFVFTVSLVLISSGDEHTQYAEYNNVCCTASIAINLAVRNLVLFWQPVKLEVFRWIGGFDFPRSPRGDC